MANPRSAGSSGGLYLKGLRLLPERVADREVFPFSVAALRDLDLELESAVTFFVGENGSGKSTLMEAIAVLAGLPVNGGSRNEATDDHGPERAAPFAAALRPSFIRRPRDGYFFRAELMAHFASLLDARKADPDFIGDPYGRYGGGPLHQRSHGEAFLALFAHRLEEGLFLMDEPESALSPQRQLTLLATIADRVASGQSQFLIATHSPI